MQHCNRMSTVPEAIALPPESGKRVYEARVGCEKRAWKTTAELLKRLIRRTRCNAICV